MFVDVALALDVQHILLLHRIEVANVDAGHFAGAQAIGEHQLDHQIVPCPHNGIPVDGAQQVVALLPRQRMFIVLLGTKTGLDPGRDVIVIMHGSAVLVEHFDDGDVAVDGEDGLALLLELLLVAQDVRPAGSPGIHSLLGEPPEP